MRNLFIPIALAMLASAPAPAQRAISTDLFGIFFEDINFAADGGLYAEMVQNRSFEYQLTDPHDGNNRDGHWHPLTAWQWRGMRSNSNELTVESAQPLNANNRHYVRVSMSLTHRGGEMLVNEGYDGMVLRRGDSYDFSAWLRLQSQGTMPVGVVLLAGDTIVCEQPLTLEGQQWTKHELTLTSTVDAEDGKVGFIFRHPGTVDIDMVSLFPQKTFRGRKNGLRPDLAEALADLKPAFVRFPGGCVAHGNGLDGIYDWKNSVLPLEQRRERRNLWGYHQTFGLGYHEYLQFCEDIGAKALPVLAAGVSCQFARPNRQQAIPMEQMPQYVQDVLDLVEYCNGDVSTTWGALRARNGHPEPFHLEYLGIGNEDQQTPAYAERFLMICKAVRERYPDIKIVGNAGPSAWGKDFEEGWRLGREAGVYCVDEHYYLQPKWFLDNQHRYDQYDRQGPRVYVGEYASKGDAWQNALAEASYLCGLERNADVVCMTSYAPLFSRDGHQQWAPDLIYFDKSTVSPSVCYEVQRLFSNNGGNLYYDNVVTLPTEQGGIAASCVKDTKTGSVIVKMVNPTGEPIEAKVNLGKTGVKGKQMAVTTMQGDPKARNHVADAAPVLPQTEQVKLRKQFTQTLPAHSFIVIRTAGK